MSLSFDLRAIARHEELLEDGRPRPLTEALVLATMIVDLGDLAEDNVSEWLYRLRVVSAHEGQLVVWNLGDRGQREPLTDADLRRHVGLKTNVKSLTTRQWLSKLAKDRERIRRMERRGGVSGAASSIDVPQES